MPSVLPTTPYLAAERLTCERDDRLLFAELSVAVEPGVMLQIAGPNGSGKTSLLRLLCGLMAPSAGEVLLRGEPLARQRGQLAEWLLWIGHASGVKGLLTAEENLAWFCSLHQPQPRAALWHALERVGLRGFEDMPCHSLSAGQQRRVALARLYLPAPPLWVLDEPYTALDRQGVAQLEERLASHCEQGGMVLFTTHHSPTRLPVGYRCLELDGRVEGQGR